MKTFDIRGIEAWQQVQSGEILEFPAINRRQVKLTVNTDGPLSVYVADNADMFGAVLLASVDGDMAEMTYTANGLTYVEFRAPADGQIFVCGSAASHVVPKTDSEKYTSVIPQGRRNTDLDRMMQFMKLNEMRRERQMRDEIAAARAQLRADMDAAATLQVTEQGDNADAPAPDNSASDPA